MSGRVDVVLFWKMNENKRNQRGIKILEKQLAVPLVLIRFSWGKDTLGGVALNGVLAFASARFSSKKNDFSK